MTMAGLRRITLIIALALVNFAILGQEGRP
jgi:hypothetical protein